MKIEIAMSFMWGLPHIGEFFFFPYLMMVLFQTLLTHNDRSYTNCYIMSFSSAGPENFKLDCRSF